MPKIAEVEITAQNLSMYPEDVQIRLDIEIGDTLEFWDIPELWTDANRLLLVNRKRKHPSAAPPDEPDKWMISTARITALKRELELDHKIEKTQ